MKTLITLACLYVICQFGTGLLRDKDDKVPFLVQAYGAITALTAIIVAYIYAIYTLCQLY